MSGNDFEILIPIIAIGGGLGLAFWSIYHKNKERMAMIEKGIAPTHTFRKKEGTHPIIKALTAMGIGLGLLASYAYRSFNEDIFNRPSTLAFVLVFGGLCYLIGYFIVQKMESNLPENKLKE